MDWLTALLHRLFHHAQRVGAVVTNPSSGQNTKYLAFQSHAVGAQNGAIIGTDGYNGAVMLEIVNAGAGTAPVTPQGSFDGINFYNLGYQRIDNQAAPARAVGPITAAAASRMVLQVLDYYEYLIVSVAAPTGAVDITVTGAAVPM